MYGCSLMYRGYTKERCKSTRVQMWKSVLALGDRVQSTDPDGFQQGRCMQSCQREREREKATTQRAQSAHSFAHSFIPPGKAELQSADKGNVKAFAVSVPSATVEEVGGIGSKAPDMVL